MSQVIFDIMPDGWDEPEERESAPPLYDCGYEPGIYFNLPEDEYHAIPALSSTGIKRILVSSMDFWAQSWMNKNYVDEETAEKIKGSAYHKRLEGKEAFDAEYAPAFNEADYPDALKTNQEIIDCLKKLGVSGYSKMKKDGLIAMLKEADPSVQIIDDLRAEYEAQHPDRKFLKPDVVREIEIMAMMIDNDPAALKCFRGGYSEVSMIWIDAETGVPMKSRVDYLKTRAIVDLKSFSNPLDKTINAAIASAVASRKYHVQAAVYSEADRNAVQLARAGHVFGDVDKGWLSKYAKIDQRMFVFVFQKTGIAPVTRVKPFSWKLTTFQCGQISMRMGIDEFARNYQHYGPDTPWLDIAPAESFADEDFPLYMTE